MAVAVGQLTQKGQVAETEAVLGYQFGLRLTLEKLGSGRLGIFGFGLVPQFLSGVNESRIYRVT